MFLCTDSDTIKVVPRVRVSPASTLLSSDLVYGHSRRLVNSYHHHGYRNFVRQEQELQI